MRKAFVVQLRKASQGMADQMEGSVEEVDTGTQFQFLSEGELIRFLRERFAEPRRSLPGSDDEKQSTDHQNASFGVHVDSSITLWFS